MEPIDVVRDGSLRKRFLTEIAYGDRILPTADAAQEDAELLESDRALTIVAWLWPTLGYLPDYDPFDNSSREMSSGTSSTSIDRRRQRRREVVATRFLRIIEATANKVGRSKDDLESHVAWATPLTERELDGLRTAHMPFSFQVILDICTALQLDFEDESWTLVDPQRLTRRIELSLLAADISRQLHFLGRESLLSVAKKLPHGSVKAGRAEVSDTYQGPEPGARYSALYETLAADERERPEYALAEIDRLLADAGERALPETAHSDRSWWAGSGVRSDARPQVSAWWGAGYRVQNLGIVFGSNRIESVIFVAVDGRAEWLADPRRMDSREFRPPVPVRLSVWPDYQGIGDGLLAFGRAVDSIPEIQRLRERNDARADIGVQLPDDRDMRLLVDFLDGQGEATRSDIEAYLNDMRGKQVDNRWMSNLLTRARRSGWIVNLGTRNSPRWSSNRRLGEFAKR